MMLPFATPADVAARWRPLSSGEEDVAKVLLADATDMIETRWPDMRDRVEAGSIGLGTLKRITANMVKRAMLNPADGVSQQAQVNGPFTLSQTFANPNGNLYLSADDVAALDGRSRRGRKAFVVDMSQTDLPSY